MKKVQLPSSFGFNLDIKIVAPPGLAGRFLFPPFSVLNAREGEWQARKRAWIACGIESEIGRGEGANKQSSMALSLAGEFENHPAHKEQLANTEEPVAKVDGLTFRSTGFMAEAMAARGGGTSIFDPVLCELMYAWFCPEGGQIVDPFAGGSVRGIVAALMGRAYHGIDLSQKQIDANEEQREKICPDVKTLKWVCGDSLKKLKDAPDADFIFSCPPYGNLEKYSDDPADISTMDYDEFITAYKRIIRHSIKKLKSDCYACFIVGDFRDKKTGNYYGFVADTIKIFQEYGAALYNDAILVTCVGSLPIRAGRQFAAGRKLGKTHQNILIFKKG